MKTVIIIRTTSIYNDSRVMKEINSLSRNGYHVVVLGWNRDGIASEKCQEVFENDVSFYFFKTQLKNIGIRHIDKLTLWFIWVYEMLNKLVNSNGIFIIHACDLDAGIPATYFVKRNKLRSLRLVYDIFDYYVDAHHIPSMVRSRIENLETSIINTADLTIICNEERKWQIRKSQPKKLVVIHNAPDLRNIEIPDISEEYDYAYCGSLAPLRLLKEIFDAYSEYQDIRMVIGGYGIYDVLAKKMDGCYQNFLFEGALSYPDVLKTEVSAKVLSAVYDPTITNHKLAAPNKFYEAMALGKPLIVCRGTGIDKIVEKENLGIIIPYNAGAFFAALYRLINDSALRMTMGNNAKKIFIKKYSWEIMEKKLLNMYDLL